MAQEPSNKEQGGQLKDRVARGVAWSMAEKVGSTFLQIAVSLTILRLLTREDLGLMAILTAASALALVLSDSGFSQTLIRKASPTERDFKSVFCFNITVSSLLYALFVGISPWVAHYYAMPQLVELAPVFFLLLPINALATVQYAIFQREFKFAQLSTITFLASLGSGVTAIGMALAGCGVWSVVAQRVLMIALRSGLLWAGSTWRPRGRFSKETLREMAPYSFSLMGTDLINTFYNKIPQFFLGRLYPVSTLGSFDQAVKLKDQPVVALTQAVQGVTFPALSKIADNAPKFAESFRQVIMVVAYMIFPLMLGMSAVAHDLFDGLLGEEWMPTVPYFRVVCLAGLFYPLTMVAFNVLKVKSDGRLIIRLEIAKKVMMTLVFAITIPLSVEAVVWGLVVIAFLDMMINFVATMRFTELKMTQILRTMLPIVAVSVAMYGAVMVVGAWLPDHALLKLGGKIVVGVLSYWLLSLAFGLEAYREVVQIIRKQFRH